MDQGWEGRHEALATKLGAGFLTCTLSQEIALLLLLSFYLHGCRRPQIVALDAGQGVMLAFPARVGRYPLPVLRDGVGFCLHNEGWIVGLVWSRSCLY